MPNIESGDGWSFGDAPPLCDPKEALPSGVRYCHDLRGQTPGGGRGSFICGKLG
eukprot:COSAG04_NODE_32141_length_253_cov_0.493506_1_plen_53_part_01